MPDDALARTTGKYVCRECQGQTLYTKARPGKPGIVYVDHTAQCETGIRNRMLATKNRRIPNVQAVA